MGAVLSFLFGRRRRRRAPLRLVAPPAAAGAPVHPAAAVAVSVASVCAAQQQKGHPTYMHAVQHAVAALDVVQTHAALEALRVDDGGTGAGDDRELALAAALLNHCANTMPTEGARAWSAAVARASTPVRDALARHLCVPPVSDWHNFVSLFVLVLYFFRANHLLKTMQFLNETNNLRNASGIGIPPNAFYCHGLLDDADLRHELRAWRANKPGVLDFAFVIEPAIKARLLHLCHLETMAEKVKDVCTLDLFSNRVRKYTANIPSPHPHLLSPYLVLNITRTDLVASTFAQLREKKLHLLKPLKVRFIDGGEEGVDHGGVQKEFFPAIFARLIEALFVRHADSGLYWPNSEIDDPESFEMFGLLLALAIYNGVNANLPLPLAFFKHIQNIEPNTMQDLAELMPTTAKSLTLMRTHPDIENTFCQTFAVAALNPAHPHKTHVLIPDGQDIAVTNENIDHFISAYIHAALTASVHPAITQIKAAFTTIAAQSANRLLQPHELQLQLCGLPPVDIDTLQEIAQYDDGYSESHPTIVDFWDVVQNTLTPAQHQQLLTFVTASTRIPIAAHAQNPLTFVIQRNGPDSDSLPSAQTCFGRLLLPQYASKHKLRLKLVAAIEATHDAGFGLA